MRTAIIGLALVLGMAASLTACNHAKTDAQVAKDTSEAQEKAADKLAKADQNAAEKEADARKDVRSERSALPSTFMNRRIPGLLHAIDLYRMNELG